MGVSRFPYCPDIIYILGGGGGKYFKDYKAVLRTESDIHNDNHFSGEDYSKLTATNIV